MSYDTTPMNTPGRPRTGEVVRPAGSPAPHRGTTVLVLGIAAWVMGNNDLREMAAGRMDPSGRDLTNAGRICGMIAGIFAIVGVAITVVVFLIWLLVVIGVFGAAVSLP